MMVTTTTDICLLFLQEIVTDARTLNIARSLRKAGWRVAIVGWKRNTAVEALSEEGLTLLWIEPPQTRMLWQWLHFLTVALGKAPAAKIYWAEDLYTLPLALWLRYRRGAQAVVYDARELYFALSSLAHRPVIQKCWQWLEQRSLPYVDGLLVSGERDLQAMEQQYQSLPPRTLVLRNLPPYRVNGRTDRLQQHFQLPPDVPIVVYQGALLPGRGIEKIIAALPLLPNWCFAIIGAGPEENTLRRYAEQYRVADRCLFLGSVPYGELLEWTASADVGVALIEPRSYSYELALPNKLFEYCQARIPVLATRLPAMQEMIDTYNLGLTIEPSASPEQIAHHLQVLYRWKRDPQWLEHCAVVARQLCWEQQEAALLRWVDTLLRNSASPLSKVSFTTTQYTDAYISR